MADTTGWILLLQIDTIVGILVIGSIGIFFTVHIPDRAHPCSK